MSINRCICHNISFKKINRIASEMKFTTVEELKSANICSTQCRLCEPYLKMMFKTGKTSFEPGLIYESGKES